jgi:hypothetical protein
MKRTKTTRYSINFEDMDAKFLNGYVAWMQSLGNSVATACMYLRNLRSIYNDSIKDGVIAETCYPFKHFKFNSNIKSKEVLYPAQLKQLFILATHTLMQASLQYGTSIANTQSHATKLNENLL